MDHFIFKKFTKKWLTRTKTLDSAKDSFILKKLTKK